MIQRLLCIHLYLMSPGAMGPIVRREYHPDRIPDHNEHHGDEALDELDDPSQWAWEVRFFRAAGASAKDLVRF